jgi:hypothetical protein
MYVLIVVAYVGALYDGAAVSMHDFSSKESCEVARKELVVKAKNWPVRPFCVPR